VEAQQKNRRSEEAYREEVSKGGRSYSRTYQWSDHFAWATPIIEKGTETFSSEWNGMRVGSWQGQSVSRIVGLTKRL
jgi:hypothetical protein